MEHLGGALRKGGVRDLLLFLPANKRDPKILEDHFKKAGLPQVADWFIRKQSAAARETIIKMLKELCEDENRTNEEVRCRLASMIDKDGSDRMRLDYRRAEVQPRRAADPCNRLCRLYLARLDGCHRLEHPHRSN